MSGLSGLFRRASWSVVDQGLSAASNLLLSVIVARTLSAEEFGGFAVAFLIFGFLIATTRATISQPLQITFSGEPPAVWTAATRSAIAASLVLGGASGSVVALTGLALANTTGHALVAVGVCLPGLLAQDTCRLAFFSSGRAKQAAFNDGLWTVLEFAGLGAALVLGVKNEVVFIVCWGGAATVAAVVAIRLLRTAPAFRGCLAWMLGQRRLTGYLFAEHLLGEGLGQVGILAVGVAGSASDVGSIRAGQVLLGPLNVIMTAVSIFGIPEIAKRRTMDRRQRVRFCWAMSLGMCAVTLGYTAVVLVLPDGIGTMLFGDTWSGAQSVLLPLSALALAVAIGAGPGVSLYGMGRARTTFGLNLLKAPTLVILLVLGIWLGGVVGAAWALAATETAMLPFLIWKTRQAINDVGREAGVGVPGVSVAGPAQEASTLSVDAQPHRVGEDG